MTENCGTSVTMPGSIMEESMTRKIAFLPLNRNFVNPYAAIEPSMRLVNSPITVTMSVFPTYCRKFSSSNARTQWSPVMCPKSGSRLKSVNITELSLKDVMIDQ